MEVSTIIYRRKTWHGKHRSETTSTTCCNHFAYIYIVILQKWVQLQKYLFAKTNIQKTYYNLIEMVYKMHLLA